MGLHSNNSTIGNFTETDEASLDRVQFAAMLTLLFVLVLFAFLVTYYGNCKTPA